MTRLSQQQVKYLVEWARRDLNELLDDGYDNRDEIKKMIINRMYFQNRRYPNYGPPVPRRLIRTSDTEYISEYVLRRYFDRMEGFRNHGLSTLTTVAMLVALGSLVYLVKRK